MEWPFIWTNRIVFTHERFVPILVEIYLLEKIFFKSSILYLLLFRYFFPLEKGWEPFIWTNLISHFGRNQPSGSGVFCYFFFSLVYFVNGFQLLRYYFLLEKGKTSSCLKTWTNLNFTSPKILFVKSGWNWPSNYREDFIEFRIFSIFSLYLVCC